MICSYWHQTDMPQRSLHVGHQGHNRSLRKYSKLGELRAMLIALSLTAALLASVPLIAFLRSRRPPQPETPADWQACPRWFCTRVRLVNGTSTRSMYLMRRPGPDGRWQFRKMTTEEFEYYANRMP